MKNNLLTILIFTSIRDYYLPIVNSLLNVLELNGTNRLPTADCSRHSSVIIRLASMTGRRCGGVSVLIEA